MYFLQSYLGERSFQVKCGRLSNTYTQGTGLVQDGVISPILFNLMINDIFDTVSNDFSYAIYADDCTVWTQGRGIARLVRSMQTTLDALAEWAQNWGFTFTPSKCKAVVFRRYMNRRELENLPALRINSEQIQYDESVKFLGVYFDTRLNLNIHVQHICT